MTVVAIDGPVASGKSSVARTVARRLGYVYLDTGAMYRAIGLLAAEAGLPLDDETAVEALAAAMTLRFDGEGRLFADGRDVSDAIRTLEAGEAASHVSALPAVRHLLVAQQRALARDTDIVMEGRDIGTNVFPDADVKVYLDAHPHVRGTRRAEELRARGVDVDYHAVMEALYQRDRRDARREVAPLRKAADAIELDTSEMTFAEVVDAILAIVHGRVGVQA